MSITYESDDTTVCTVSSPTSSGCTINGINAGTTTINAYIVDTETQETLASTSTTITVEEPTPQATISITTELPITATLQDVSDEPLYANFTVSNVEQTDTVSFDGNSTGITGIFTPDDVPNAYDVQIDASVIDSAGTYTVFVKIVDANDNVKTSANIVIEITN